MLLQTLAAVAMGSALGGVARFAVGHFAGRWLGLAFPWGTLAVNVAGSALIGYLAAVLGPQPSTARWFWMTGICGGFTTFSAFSLEAFSYFRQGDLCRAALYVSASVLLCGFAVAGGASLGRGR